MRYPNQAYSMYRGATVNDKHTTNSGLLVSTVYGAAGWQQAPSFLPYRMGTDQRDEGLDHSIGIERGIGMNQQHRKPVPPKQAR
jgi:hypothetical protein